MREPSAIAGWRRLLSSATDGVAWLLAFCLFSILATEIGYGIFGHPPHTGDPRNEVSIFSIFLAVLFANFVLAAGNAWGTSIGRALTGTWLVMRVGDCQVRPGLRRGLVRATLQWLPFPHDGFAGTHVVLRAAELGWKTLPPRLPPPPPLPLWMVVLAVLAQCLFAFCLMIASAF